MMLNNNLFNLRTWVLVSLTLGLAPFFPAPHIWGKLQWLVGGASGMQAMDWFDVVLHGTPWVILIIILINKGLQALSKAKKS